MDLYFVLGLQPGASSEDIKRAYRRLARRFHPGINPGDGEAEMTYRRITEAYETLVDPERRRAYDASGARPSDGASALFEFSGFDFSSAALGSQAATFSELFADVLHPSSPRGEGAESGPDLHAEVTVSFEEAMWGVERQIVVTRFDECETCGGAGQVRAAEVRCHQCDGTGKVRWARGHMVFTKSCAACDGAGRHQTARCRTCGGHGRHARSESVRVVVPKGVHDGARLRVPARGHAGRRGGSNGDLYVTVHVQTDPVFRREGDDLHIVVPLGVHEAVLGTRIDVPSLNGAVQLRIPPGTRAGQRFRLRDRGAPTAAGGRGDLIIETRLVLPEVVDERAKEFMRDFGRLYTTDLRRDLRR
ncbi:MAG TPA: J domain-containing protein [Vicinamibacterales bacterium]|nr:J domain-containing protein [Vicinamibacterales bacterium]